ncbi:11669_t:CDS:1, partial [Acaulospora colombiana]
QTPAFGPGTFSTQIFPNNTNTQNVPLVQSIPTLQPLTSNPSSAPFLTSANSIMHDQQKVVFTADPVLPIQPNSSVIFPGSQQDQISALLQGQYSNISHPNSSSGQNIANVQNVLNILQNSQPTALPTSSQWETPALGLIIPTDAGVVPANNTTHNTITASMDSKPTEQVLQSSISPHLINPPST